MIKSTLRSKCHIVKNHTPAYNISYQGVPPGANLNQGVPPGANLNSPLKVKEEILTNILLPAGA